MDHNTNLSMAGKIRTKEKCPKCKGKFSGEPLVCADCSTHPNRYYIDIYVSGIGKVKLYSDSRNLVLSSWESAYRTITRIRSEIDDKSFDPTKYVAGDKYNFLFETRIEAWYEDKKQEVKKGHLAESYLTELKRYKDKFYTPFFKGNDVREIRTFHIDTFYKQLPPDFSLKYYKNILCALENFFNTLRRHEYTEKPLAFPVIVVERKAPKWVSREVQAEFIEAIRPIYRPIFTFLAFQGIRPGEGRALKVKDLNFENNTLTVQRTFSKRIIREKTKGKDVRPRALNPILIPMLKELCKDKHPEAYVFVNYRTGKPYSEDILFDRWSEAREKTGIRVTLTQATRHSFASNLVCDGANLAAISKLLGHTDIKTTMIYADANVTAQNVAFEKQATLITLRPQTGPNKKTSNG